PAAAQSTQRGLAGHLCRQEKGRSAFCAHRIEAVRNVDKKIMTKTTKRMKEKYRSPNGKSLSSDRRAPSCFVIRLARRRLANVTRPLFLLLMVLPALHAEDSVSVLGSKPRWSVLERYKQTITRDEFAHLINDVYCTHGFASDLIETDGNTARILINRAAQEFFTLRFAANSAECKPVPRLW